MWVQTSSSATPRTLSVMSSEQVTRKAPSWVVSTPLAASSWARTSTSGSFAPAGVSAPPRPSPASSPPTLWMRRYPSEATVAMHGAGDALAAAGLLGRKTEELTRWLKPPSVATRRPGVTSPPTSQMWTSLFSPPTATRLPSVGPGGKVQARARPGAAPGPVACSACRQNRGRMVWGGGVEVTGVVREKVRFWPQTDDVSMVTGPVAATAVLCATSNPNAYTIAAYRPGLNRAVAGKSEWHTVCHGIR